MLLVCAAACYYPDPIAGEDCGSGGRCPRGLVCDLATNTCETEVPEPARFRAIDGGYDHTCGIDLAGRAWCWGNNASGELGVGDADPRVAPAPVGTDTDWAAISAGFDATCGIRTDGTLWCWGASTRIGLDGPDRPRQVVDPFATWAQVAVGFDGFCAATTGGAVYCLWNPAAPDAAPTLVTTNGIIPRRLSASAEAQCMIDEDGALYCWGDNTRGRVGNGDDSGAAVAAPAPIMPGVRWTAVAVGESHTCAIDGDQGLWCWGSCSVGQTGQGTGSPTGCSTPERVGTPVDRFMSVDAGSAFTCAVAVDGRMVCFGVNDHGQLGDRAGELVDGLVVRPGLDGWAEVATGTYHGCGLRDGGEAWCWGNNNEGQLGDGRGGIAWVPVQVGTDADWERVALGSWSTCGIRTDGTLWCWGWNGRGQLGDGTQVERHRPVRVGTDAGWATVEVGHRHACGIRGGALWCWGWNEYHQLGTGMTADAIVPARVGTLDGWTGLGLVTDFSCGLRGTALYCWGGFQLDDTPEPLRPDLSWGSLSAMSEGAGFGGASPQGAVCALADMRLYCWGSDGAITTPAEPGADWQQFSIGRYHGCGVASAAEAWCIGIGSSGELGDGLAADSQTVAVRVDGGLAWRQVDAGERGSCGIAMDDALYCWGAGFRAGVDDRDQVRVPTPVMPGTRWKTLGLGEDQTCAIQLDGTLWCWGMNRFGERGDGGGGGARAVRVLHVEGMP
jgi:alpha-tubulin suppressor-like RCC1 family protein